MAKKVAYVVYRGHTPGVYRNWEDVQKQLKDYKNNYQRGFTIAQGGIQRAEAELKTYLASNRGIEDAAARSQYSLSRGGFGFQGSLSTVDHLPVRNGPARDGPARNDPARNDPAPDVPSTGKRKRASTDREELVLRRVITPNQGHRREFGEEHYPTPLAIRSTSLNSQTGTSESSEATSSKDSNTSPGSYGTLDRVSLASYDDNEAEAEYDDASLDGYLANDPIAPSTTVPTGPTLCDEQADLVSLIMSGRNTFYTGSAGCGKSTVLKAFVKELRNMGKKVHSVAPTGRAALNINGSTIWTYASWTPDSMRQPLSTQWTPNRRKEPLSTLCQDAHRKFPWRRFRSTDVLVIDEISMVENLLLERLNCIMKEARGSEPPLLGSERAFGGIQVVVTGDFCQLPPVRPFKHCLCGEELRNEYETTYTCSEHGKFLDTDKWAFKSKAWEECNFEHVNLTTIHRQSDYEFKRILELCRLGKPLSSADRHLLLYHESETRNAVQLFPKCEDVKILNDWEFSQLRTPEHTFGAHDGFEWNENHVNLKSKMRPGSDGHLSALEEHRFEARIELKRGMQVVLLVNLDLSKGLVNGSQGKIVDFMAHADQRLPEQTGEYKEYKARQIKSFISRNAKYKVWPVVRFTNGVVHTIFAHCIVEEMGDFKPYSLMSRTQIPLMAAWAMTVHKSQGMTLDRVIVDLKQSFAEGQEYVALSRARSLHGLQVKSLKKSARGANDQVKEFLREKFGIS